MTPPIRAGTGGGGDGVEILQAAARIGERAADQTVEGVDMGAGGDFRHHAAIGRMFGDLAQNGVGQDLAASHGNPSGPQPRRFRRRCFRSPERAGWPA